MPCILVLYKKTKLNHNMQWVIILNKKRIIIPIVIFLALILTFIVLKLNTSFSLTIEIDKDFKQRVAYKENFIYPQAIARYKGSILPFWNKEMQVFTEDKVDTETIGTYTLNYNVSYKDVAASAYTMITVYDDEAPKIELFYKKDYYTKPGFHYVDEGFKATDNYDGDLTGKVEITTDGNIVTYTVADSSGNRTTVQREIKFLDEQPPTLIFSGGNVITHSAGQEFTDPGYTAIDDCDGILTDKVKVTGNVDVNVPGEYELTYTVTDSYNNTTVGKRIVRVMDDTPPVIKLKGESDIYMIKGTGFTEPGFTATDAISGDLTQKVTVKGSVDTSRFGIYTLTYSVSDAAGNVANATRRVYVYARQDKSDIINPGKKVVYLTFDDGPGPNTEKLLKVLDKYGVKATFFVVGRKSGADIIKKEFEEGHTVAMHTMSHVYSQIYASDEAYFKDLGEISNYIKTITGEEPKLLRFPGGSSNQVSKKYNAGIMSRLVKSVEKMGYRYFDWNITSGDEDGITNTSELASRIISGMNRNDISVVLQHDTRDYSINAVERVIVYGLANGYTFLPLTENSPECHHRVAN